MLPNIQQLRAAIKEEWTDIPFCAQNLREISLLCALKVLKFFAFIFLFSVVVFAMTMTMYFCHYLKGFSVVKHD